MPIILTKMTPFREIIVQNDLDAGRCHRLLVLLSAATGPTRVGSGFRSNATRHSVARFADGWAPVRRRLGNAPTGTASDGGASFSHMRSKR